MRENQFHSSINNGFALCKLEDTILEESRLATHSLRNYDEVAR